MRQRERQRTKWNVPVATTPFAHDIHAELVRIVHVKGNDRPFRHTRLSPRRDRPPLVEAIREVGVDGVREAALPDGAVTPLAIRIDEAIRLTDSGLGWTPHGVGNHFRKLPLFRQRPRPSRAVAGGAGSGRHIFRIPSGLTTFAP